MSSGREAVSRSAGEKPHAPHRANGVTCPHPPLHLQSAADGLDNGGGGGGGGGARAGGAGGPATSSPPAPSQLEMEAARWDGAGEGGGGGDGGAAQGGAAAAADGDVAAGGEAPSWFSRPRLPRAQRASLARRMMVLTKAIIG